MAADWYRGTGEIMMAGRWEATVIGVTGRPAARHVCKPHSSLVDHLSQDAKGVTVHDHPFASVAIDHGRHVRVLLRRRRHGRRLRRRAQSPKDQKKPEATITLTTKPTPPAAGETTFTVTAKDADGKPITGADVSVELVMPPMGAMGEMKNTVALKPSTDPKVAAEGTYVGNRAKS